jgi:hypothetical protein
MALQAVASGPAPTHIRRTRHLRFGKLSKQMNWVVYFCAYVIFCLGYRKACSSACNLVRYVGYRRPARARPQPLPPPYRGPSHALHVWRASLMRRCFWSSSLLLASFVFALAPRSSNAPVVLCAVHFRILRLLHDALPCRTSRNMVVTRRANPRLWRRRRSSGHW